MKVKINTILRIGLILLLFICIGTMAVVGITLFWVTSSPGTISQLPFSESWLKPQSIPQGSITLPDKWLTDRPPLDTLEAKYQKDKELFFKDIADKLKTRNFKGLEDLAKKARSSSREMKDGSLRLPLFFKGVEKAGKSLQPVVYDEILREWHKHSPHCVDPYVAVIMMLTNRGWDIRGAGYANSVSEAHFNQFTQFLNLANTFVNEAKKSKETSLDPELSAYRLVLATGLNASKKDTMAYFEEAQKIDPNYYPSYGRMVIYLLPQWHGSQQEVVEFIDKASQHPKIKMKDWMYSYMAKELMMYGTTRSYPEHFFANYPLSYKRIQEGFIERDKHTPLGKESFNAMAWFAVAAGDKVTAKKLFQYIGHQADMGIWKNQENFNRWKTFCTQE